MPSTKTAAPEPRLPEHAVAEISEAKGARKAELAQFWDRWLAVGEAKTTERAAFAALVEAQQALAECHLNAVRRKPGMTLAADECGCGKHAKPVVASLKERERAKAAIPRAEQAFKGG